MQINCNSLFDAEIFIIFHLYILQNCTCLVYACYVFCELLCCISYLSIFRVGMCCAWIEIVNKPMTTINTNHRLAIRFYSTKLENISAVTVHISNVQKRSCFCAFVDDHKKKNLEIFSFTVFYSAKRLAVIYF